MKLTRSLQYITPHRVTLLPVLVLLVADGLAMAVAAKKIPCTGK